MALRDILCDSGNVLLGHAYVLDYGGLHTGKLCDVYICVDLCERTYVRCHGVWATRSGCCTVQSKVHRQPSAKSARPLVGNSQFCHLPYNVSVSCM